MSSTTERPTNLRFSDRLALKHASRLSQAVRALAAERGDEHFVHLSLHDASLIADLLESKTVETVKRGNRLTAMLQRAESLQQGDGRD